MKRSIIFAVFHTKIGKQEEISFSSANKTQKYPVPKILSKNEQAK